MEVVADFKAVDPIFKGSYGDSFLYSNDDLAQLRKQKVYLPVFQEEITMPPAPSYRQISKPVAAKPSPHRITMHLVHMAVGVIAKDMKCLITREYCFMFTLQTERVLYVKRKTTNCKLHI